MASMVITNLLKKPLTSVARTTYVKPFMTKVARVMGHSNFAVPWMILQIQLLDPVFTGTQRVIVGFRNILYFFV